jgi:hypothetical protein
VVVRPASATRRRGEDCHSRPRRPPAAAATPSPARTPTTRAAQRRRLRVRPAPAASAVPDAQSSTAGSIQGAASAPPQTARARGTRRRSTQVHRPEGCPRASSRRITRSPGRSARRRWRDRSRGRRRAARRC